MRRLLLAAMMIGAMTSARAADLPFLRGGFTDGLSRSSVNWAGFYAGAQGGYGSADERFSSANSAMLAGLLDHNVIQQMDVANWDLGLSGQSHRSGGYGAFFGYNAQWEDVVYGLEVSYLHGSFAGLSSASKGLVSGGPLSDGLFHDVRVTSSAGMSISDMATFRGRAAYAWGCFLPYIFGGFALGNADITRTVLVQDAIGAAITGPFNRLLPLSATDTLNNHLIYGYTAGLGVDVNLVGGLFARAEWEYIRFTTSIDTNVNTVRAGLGYKF